MKLSLNHDSAEALRELAASMPAAVCNIVESTEKLISVYQSVSDTLGVHRQSFYELLKLIKQFQSEAVGAIELLPGKMNQTADLIDRYVSSGGNNGTSGPGQTANASCGEAGNKTKHLSKDEVNERWKQTLRYVDVMIDNYRNELISRGVPEGKWLNETLAAHRAAMLEQEGHDLDVASGHAGDSVLSENAYSYPEDYFEFYDGLTDEFRDYCLKETNPGYESGVEYRDNCQRCVPAHEMIRRGADVTACPSTSGTDHLAYYPFDVWRNARVVSGSGNGKSDIENAMSSWGDGARAQVVVVWNDGFGVNGHTFIAEQINGVTHFSDPQSDEKDVSYYFDDVLEGETRFCRIDNLETSDYIRDCVKPEGSI